MESKEKYIKFLQDKNNRKRIDKAILEFFGLDTKYIIPLSDIKDNSIILEFFIMLNEEFLFKIKVLDSKNLFKESKQFFLNFCNKHSKRKFTLVLPCYWEIYYHNCKENNNNKKILDFANIFNYQKESEIINAIKKI